MESKKRTIGSVFAALGKSLCYLLLFLACQSLVSVGYALTITLYATTNPELGIDPMELTLACTDQISLISGLLTLLLLAVFFLLRRINPLRETGFRATPGRFVAASIAMTPLLYAVITFVLSLLPEAWMESYLEASASLGQTGILMTIATVLIAPLVEEIIFRGLILSRLHRAIPGWLAVLISALVFGLCHGQIVWICYAFVIGLLFGLMALRSNSIWPSLLAHIIFNGIGQFSVYLPDTDTAALILFGALTLVSVAAMPIAHRGMTSLFSRKAT